MGGNRIVFLCATLTFFVTINSEGNGWNSAGYIPGDIGMPPINVSNCMNDVLLTNPSLSNALECARTCHAKEPAKTCYYSFVIERYPTNGEACSFCTPNVTNSICADCQCVPTDGIERMALTVNRMIPGPSIQVCLGDYVVVDVMNQIKEDAITIHWHGVYQHDYQYYDGVPDVTQCPIAQGNSFRYQFRVKNGGTHFWHAHTGLQKMDGVFGSIIVRDPVEEDPVRDFYDTDWASHVAVISDWMHEEATGRFPGRTSGVVGQHPDALLIDGKGRTKDSNGVLTNTSLAVFPIETGKRHRFRLINSFCTTCPGQITIENHTLTVIATDGVPIKPVVVNSIISYPGERYDFVINADQIPGAYWIQLRSIGECVFKEVYQLGTLQYANASTIPRSPPPRYTPGIPAGIVLNPMDASCQTPNPMAICVNQLQSLLPSDPALELEEPDVKAYMPVGFRTFLPQDIFQPDQYKGFLEPVPGLNLEATVNGISFRFPPSPLISQMRDIPPNVICSPENLPRGCTGNCTCTQVFKVRLHSVTEIILVDESQIPDMFHPFHLHGYSYRVLSMGQPLGPYTGNAAITVDYVKQLDREGKLHRRLYSPASKDTLAIPNNGYVVIRFRADNPGFWLFHCHFIYHQLIGMTLVIQVGEQRDLPPVPPHFPKCGDFKPPILGNRRSFWGPHKFYDLRHKLMEPVEDILLPPM